MRLPNDPYRIKYPPSALPSRTIGGILIFGVEDRGLGMSKPAVRGFARVECVHTYRHVRSVLRADLLASNHLSPDHSRRILGIRLMPRIRNWKQLVLFCPSIDPRRQHHSGGHPPMAVARIAGRRISPAARRGVKRLAAAATHPGCRATARPWSNASGGRQS